MKVDIKNRIKEKFTTNKNCIFPERNLLIEVTNRCNNKCIFCYNRNMTRSHGDIDFDLATRVLKECYELGTREVGFYATGEPLLYDKLDILIQEAKNIGYSYVYLTTNGLLANKEKIEPLLSAGLDSIKFSINAINREDYLFIHGIDAFDIVIKNLKTCKELQKTYNNKLFVSCILTSYIDYDKKDVEEFFAKYCDTVVVQYVKNQGGLLPQINECLISKNAKKEKFNIPCSYVFNSITITKEGFMTACCMDFQNFLAYADLNKTSVKKGWNNAIISAVRKRQTCGNVDNTICIACVYGKSDGIQPLVKEFATIFDTKDKDIEMLERIKNKESCYGKNRFV